MLALSTASFFLCDQLLRGFAGVGSEIDYARLPVSALPLLMLVITLASLVLEPLQNAISRHFERQSDRYALHRTRAPAAYSSAFRKLAKLNKADPQPHPLEVFLFHSHPPISERLAYADASVGASHPE
jgi:STE24 endopeptidase